MNEVVESKPTTISNQEVMERVRRLKQAVWQRRPILGDIMKKHGADTLYDYAHDFMDANPSPLLDARKHELLGVVEELTEKRLGKTVAEAVRRQLQKLPLVSTADHHAFIQHPFWVNANIISGIPFISYNDPEVRNLIVFSFSSISVNNASGYPRGLLFHGSEKSVAKISKLPLLPDKLKMSTVYNVHAYTKEDIKKADQTLERMVGQKEADQTIVEKLKNILNEFFATQEVLESDDFCSQITKINYKIWPRFFSGESQQNGEKDCAPPGLIYLEIETIVRELLLRFHLTSPNSLINKVIFDEQYQKILLELFNNLPGAFSLQDQSGTHLFWGVDEKKHRVRLFLDNGKLSSVDKKIVIDLTQEAIAEALRTKQIFSSMLLCYLVVSLYYGMKCLGGFCQVHDLTMIKAAWQKLLERVGEKEESDATASVQTKELGGDGMVLAYLRSDANDTVPATGLDMILYSGNTSFKKYVAFSKFLSLGEIMDPMIPEMYTVLYPATEREKDLMEITPEQIAHANGLDEKARLTNHADYLKLLSDYQNKKR